MPGGFKFQSRRRLNPRPVQIHGPTAGEHPPRPAFRVGNLLFWAALSLLIFPSFVYSTMQLPDPLQDLGHSPRAEALASAYTASEGRDDSLYWNPSGLASITTPQLSIVYQGWFPGQFRENFTAVIPFSQFGVIGMGADYASYGTFQQYDANGYPIAAHQPYRGSFTLGFAFPFIDSLSLGFTGMGMLDSQSANGQNISGYMTAGFLWSGIQPIKIGAFYSSTDSDVPEDKSLLKMGASCPQTFFEGNPTLFLFDFSLPPQGVYALQAGVEQILFGSIFARAGYQWALDNNSMPGFQGLAAGLGVKWKEWSLDYAFTPYGELGTSQTVGLCFTFPEGSRQPLQNPAPLSQAAFKPADSLLPGDKIVNVEIDLSIPKDTSPTTQSSVSPQMAQNIHILVQKVAQNPQDAQAWNTLGNLYWQIGRADYAVQCFEEVLQLQPDNQALKDWLDKYKAIHSNPGPGKE